MLNIQKYSKIFLSNSASWNKQKNILWHLIFLFLYCQPTTFWAMPIPRENTPDWVKQIGVSPGKRPYAWEQNIAIFWEPSLPKMLQVGSLQPPGHDVGNLFNNLSKEWPSNHPFVTDKVVGLQIIDEPWRTLWDYLLGCNPSVGSEGSVLFYSKSTQKIHQKLKQFN